MSDETETPTTSEPRPETITTPATGLIELRDEIRRLHSDLRQSFDERISRIEKALRDRGGFNL